MRVYFLTTLHSHQPQSMERKYFVIACITTPSSAESSAALSSLTTHHTALDIRWTMASPSRVGSMIPTIRSQIFEDVVWERGWEVIREKFQTFRLVLDA